MISGSWGAWRWPFLALVVALAMLTVPTAGSSQTSDAPTLRLHVGSDGAYFRYTPNSGPPVTQVIGAPKRCQLTVTGPLAALDGSDKGPGLSDNGIGIKSGGSQGTPCSRVDNSEELSVELLEVPAAESAELDLEFKGSTQVRIHTLNGGALVDTFTIRAGTAVVPGVGVDGSAVEPFGVAVTSAQPIGNCRNDSDAGPDSGSRDNCRVSITPSGTFDQVVLAPTMGEVSLEGSGDFGNDPAFDTIFHLTSYDGELGCDEDTNTAYEVDGATEGRIVRYENTDGSDCVLKPYVLQVTADDPAEGGLDSVVFEIDDPVTPVQPAIYEAFLTFDQPLSTPLDAVLEYDPDRTDGYDQFKQAPACIQDPFDLADDPAGSLNDEAIPAGHEACVIDVTQEWDGTTTWHAIFAGDWKFRG